MFTIPGLPVTVTLFLASSTIVQIQENAVITSSGVYSLYKNGSQNFKFGVLYTVA